jgi:tetratricopeptide (TPR) repeat protein
MAYIYYQNSNEEKGLHICNKILEIDPNHAQTYGLMAKAHTRSKEYHKALECLSRANQLEPAEEEFWRGLGFCYYLFDSD